MAVRFLSQLRIGGGLLALAALFLVLLIAAPAGARGLRADRGHTSRPVAHHFPLSRPPLPLSRPPLPPPRPSLPQPQPSYLALGDSLAFGFSDARFEALAPEENPAGFDTGYVDDFGKVLKLFNPRLQIVNDGCPGETTVSFIEGPCAYQLTFRLHHPYVGGTRSSQLSDALAYLGAHPGTVNPITLDIGANDVLGLVGSCKGEPACLAAGAPEVFKRVATNLGLILGDLRAAAPHAQIIVLGLYNPFGEKRMPGSDALTVQLNEVEAGVAAAFGARFADPLPIFNPPGALEEPTICLLTNMCTPQMDIHPTDIGYAVLAGVILQQYVLSLPRARG